MAKKDSLRGHTGLTESGNTRDAKVEKIGRVTIYKRGKTYYLYYRENGRSLRQKVEGNLATARSMAGRTSSSVEEGAPSPFGFKRVPTAELIDSFIDSCELVRGLTPRTVDRYRAALRHLKDFAKETRPGLAADQVTVATVEEFVKWLRQQTRTRNGAKSGKPGRYSMGGIGFILNTCRTVFN